MGYKSIVGQKIKIARTMHKPPMSQADLLAKLQIDEIEISQPTLSKIENGLRPLTAFEATKFAKALEVDLEWLLSEKEITIK